ncbi:MAG: GIY-YIG nuclease family protein [Chloroflexi bacterium]|nr:GIY-YIG nuclease family protein [Chloroflexota bacterium]
MMETREYYVYIMSNWSRTLYIGVTNNLMARVDQHKRKVSPGFTARYNVTDLVYYESTGDVTAAIEREKQLKGWLRKKKIALIESVNPEWRDLSLDWADRLPQILRQAQNDKTGQAGTTGDILG